MSIVVLVYLIGVTLGLMTLILSVKATSTTAYGIIDSVAQFNLNPLMSIDTTSNIGSRGLICHNAHPAPPIPTAPTAPRSAITQTFTIVPNFQLHFQIPLPLNLSHSISAALLRPLFWPCFTNQKPKPCSQTLKMVCF